jgi:hypothetical protein
MRHYTSGFRITEPEVVRGQYEQQNQHTVKSIQIRDDPAKQVDQRDGAADQRQPDITGEAILGDGR